ncbi:hypothetical protein [Cellulosimicrobium cellulans]|uniref:Uncharacterized protein n=1 Tax=Cellulosimicrobium cellulans TaxID=1710 RepID=A0A4Y4E868_CELCE|nr:hypothetical protein [Cellulosimicrobium cellulans]GED11688.1 hypothetical protein CCE02nite_36870 [Cellulosimicrobium cellulans]
MTDKLPEPADDAAWVSVPDGVDGDLDRLADHCRALVTAWFEMARGNAVPPGADSPAAIDAGQFRQERPSAPANVEHGPGQQAGLYVDAIGQHLLAIEALLRARRVAVAVWPLVRAELELAGRVAWLLEPRIEQPAGAVRVARLYLEMISSLQRDRYTAGKFSKAAEKRSKSIRDQKTAEARDLFDRVEVDLSSPGRLDSWSIGGESLPGLGDAVGLFIELNFAGGAKAVYDILSDYSHPSLSAIARQTTPVEVDGVAMRPWRVDVKTVERQVHYACAILYKAAHFVAGYYELDASPLERWVESTPGEWFGPDAEDNR